MRATGFELLGLQPIDSHGEAAPVTLHRRHVLLEGGEIGEDGVHGGLRVGWGNGIAHDQVAGSLG